MDKEQVTISKSYYEELEKDSEILAALYSYGVDNWPGFEEAMASLSDED